MCYRREEIPLYRFEYLVVPDDIHSYNYNTKAFTLEWTLVTIVVIQYYRCESTLSHRCRTNDAEMDDPRSP